MPSDLHERFEALLRELGGRLRSAALRRLPRDLGVGLDELEQEIRIRLWQALERETEIRGAASSLERVAMTAAIDAVRRVRARREEPLEMPVDGEDEPRVTLPDPSISPERRAELAETGRRIELALAVLSEDRRIAVEMYLQGFEIDEIARTLDWTRGRARNLVYRGLADLRAELRTQGIADE